MVLFENQIITGVLLGILVSMLSFTTNVFVAHSIKEVSHWGGWVAGFLTRLGLFLAFMVILFVFKNYVAFDMKINTAIVSLFIVVIFGAIIDTMFSLYRIKKEEQEKLMVRQAHHKLNQRVMVKK